MKKHKLKQCHIIGLIISVCVFAMLLFFHSRKDNIHFISKDEALSYAQNEVTLFMTENNNKFPNKEYSLVESSINIEFKYDAHYSKDVYIVYLEYYVPDVSNIPVFEITIDAASGGILSNYNNYT